MFGITVSPDLLMVVFGALLAVLFDWAPGLQPWYDSLSELKKKQVMGVALLAIAGVFYGGSCYGLFSTALTCDKQGIADLVQMVFFITVSNQGIHALTKPTTAYKAKQLRG